MKKRPNTSRGLFFIASARNAESAVVLVLIKLSKASASGGQKNLNMHHIKGPAIEYIPAMVNVHNAPC